MSAHMERLQRLVEALSVQRNHALNEAALAQADLASAKKEIETLKAAVAAKALEPEPVS